MISRASIGLSILLSALALLSLGCAQKKVVIEKSPPIASAERLEHRALSAYNKGDLIGAAKDLNTALQVYDSLALLEAAAGVHLSLARIDSDEGRGKEALVRINRVLSISQNTNTLLLAHGRAAALHLQQKDYAAANAALSRAEQLCGNSCEASSALLTLRANWSLASGDAASAKVSASNALARSLNPNDRANALRGLAEANLALGQLLHAASEAEEALQIDQTQGHSLRVISDLNLLTRIYSKANNPSKSAEFAALSASAVNARKQLIRP